MMLDSLSALNVQINNLFYTPLILRTGTAKEKEDDKEQEETTVQMSEYDVITALKYEPYDPGLTARDLVLKYGLTYLEAANVLEKYHEMFAQPQQDKINQNPPQGDTFTYMS